MINKDHSVFADSLWYDDSIFAHRYQKSASALTAINDILSQQRPLNNKQESCFLQQYDWLSKQPAELFSKIWVDPTCYWWTRTTYHLLASVLNQIPLSSQAEGYLKQTGAESIKEALASMLLQFYRFVLGVLIHSKQSGYFEIPLTVNLPFSVPGTELILFGTGKCDIVGFEPGFILLTDKKINITEHRSYEPTSDEQITVVTAAHAEYRNCSLLLNPYLYNNLPGLTFTSALDDVDLDFQHNAVDLVQSGLAVLARFHPEVFRQFADNVYAMALKPLYNGRFTNMAYSDLPGTFIISYKNNPYELADIFIHEFHHNRLFFFEEQGSFFSQQSQVDPLNDSVFYSPWRDDLRPLHGILHAAYVYTPVNEFWLSVLKHGGVDKAHRDYAIDRLLRGVMQVHIGLYILKQQGNLTPAGKGIVDDIQARLNKITEEIRPMNLSYALQATVCFEDGTLMPETNPVNQQAMTIQESLLSHIKTVAPAKQIPALQSLYQSFQETFTSSN